MELGGSDLEDHAQATFQRMGLVCIHHLKQARLCELDPGGTHSRSEHLEIDLLIPHKEICLVGEITARSNQKDVEKKYRIFRNHFDLLAKIKLNEKFWRILGVPEGHLKKFRDVKQLRGFFITTKFQRYDISLSEVQKLALFYSTDWSVLEEYSIAIGHYARPFILNHFQGPSDKTKEQLILRDDENLLICSKNKKVASYVDLADVYTFAISPYQILPIAHVQRRDELPEIQASEIDNKYQRPLITKKLREIRKVLRESDDFMFPNSVLAVLSNKCRYSDTDGELRIPKSYGAISIIDGQHRLFSYADENIKKAVENNAEIMVTAIQFKDTDEEKVRRYSARTFVEINTNQTRIKPSLLAKIAYENLGDTGPRAIAAQILLKVNERKGQLYGLFDTSLINIGIQINTVLTQLKRITNLERIQKLNDINSGVRGQQRVGYENLFRKPVKDLNDANTLINAGVVCFEHYFNCVAKVFKHDWPQRNLPKGSSLELAKVMAGLVKLLQQFIKEGTDWPNVEKDLVTIRNNIKTLCGVAKYTDVLLDQNDTKIPDSRASVADDFKFFNENRRRPTSIQKVKRS